jgi:hypothetical protein
MNVLTLLFLASSCLFGQSVSVEVLIGRMPQFPEAEPVARELIARPRAEVLPLLVQSLQPDGRLAQSEDGRYWAYHVLTTYTDSTPTGQAFSDPSIINLFVLGLQDSMPATRQCCAGSLARVDAEHTKIAVEALTAAIASYSERPVLLAGYMAALESMGTRAAASADGLLKWLANPTGAHSEYWQRIRNENEDEGLYGDLEVLVRRRAASTRLAIGLSLGTELTLYESLDVRGRSAATSALCPHLIRVSKSLAPDSPEPLVAAVQNASRRLARSIADPDLPDDIAKDAAFALAVVHGLNVHSSETVAQIVQALASVPSSNERRRKVADALRAMLEK